MNITQIKSAAKRSMQQMEMYLPSPLHISNADLLFVWRLTPESHLYVLFAYYSHLIISNIDLFTFVYCVSMQFMCFLKT